MVKKVLKEVAEDTGHAALLLLKLLASAGESFPPVKAIASTAIQIADLVLAFKSNQRQWKELGVYIQTMVVTVMQFIPEAKETRDDLNRCLLNLKQTLTDIETKINTMYKRNCLERFRMYLKDPDAISDMRKDVESALAVFHLNAVTTTGIDATQIMKIVHDIEKYVKCINDKLSDKIVFNMALNTLPYAEGAAWNLRRGCLPGTREAIQETIWQWINSAHGSERAEIFCIADVAGSGKSALSHSVAKRCYDNNVLGSSFFFDHETADRNTPRKLITTLARDLSSRSKDIANDIVLVIEEEPGIVMSQSISHQFHKLILDPYSRHPPGRPFAVVIDALDEGYDNELLMLLCEEMPKLPPCFRIFLTTRPKEDIVTLLLHAPHVRHQTLDIHSEQNLSDIAIYARSRLHEVALRKRMGSHWPSRQVVRKFTEMAEGLFIWVSTICDYLLHSTAPDRKLNALIKGRTFSCMAAEEKMTKLYSTVLNSCNWDDSDFVEGYQLVMGAIIALKTPLPSDALQSLHRNSDLRISEVTLSLAPLLSGSTEDGQPIRLPHLSLYDFIAHQAYSLPDCRKFYIDERYHSKRLARLCLAVLEQDLTPGSPGTGYLLDAHYEDRNLPITPEKEVSEVMQYTCRFWIDHVVDISGPLEAQLVCELEAVLLTKLVPWTELCCSYATFQRFRKLRDWMHTELPKELLLFSAIYRLEIAQKLVNLCDRLAFHGRTKEALECAKEATEISEEIASRCPSPENESVYAYALNSYACRLQDMGDREGALHAAQAAVSLREKACKAKGDSVDADLANYLTTLSRTLSYSGKLEDSLATIRRAVYLQRALLKSDPRIFKHSLAASLNTLSARLSECGRTQAALEAAEETVQLRRELAGENPQRHLSGLAISLNTLSARLGKMGKTKEALDVAQESVKLQRECAADGPATHRIRVAGSLHTLSARLASLNMSGEALKVAQEAAEITKQSAEENPRAFRRDYALSLDVLSRRLSASGRFEEALHAGEDSVEICRELARERPKAYSGSLAMSLCTLARRYAELNRTEDALRTAEDCVGILRPLAAEHPAAFNSHLLDALKLEVGFYSTLGRLTEEQAVSKEVLRLTRRVKNLRKKHNKARKELVVSTDNGNTS